MILFFSILITSGFHYADASQRGKAAFVRLGERRLQGLPKGCPRLGTPRLGLAPGRVLETFSTASARHRGTLVLNEPTQGPSWTGRDKGTGGG